VKGPGRGTIVDFEFSEEQKILRQTVRRFVEEQCPREYVRELDRTGEFPQALWQKMADLGFLGLPVSGKYGGSEGTMVDMVIVIEELAKRILALAIPFTNTIGLTNKVVSALGTEGQKAEILPKLVKGGIKTCFAWTEASGGTDVLAMKTFAEKSHDGEKYVINGSKLFITLAHVADCIFTVLRTLRDPPKKAQGISCLIVPSRLPGISINPIEKVGQKSTGFCEIHFDNVEVPRECLLGEENKGWYQLIPLLNGERTCFSAICLGIAEAAFEDAVRYMSERTAFGKTINSFQILQHYVADMKTMIDACQLLTYKAAWLETTGKQVSFEATEAYLACSNMVHRVTDLGMQILGGYGYTTEFDMERYWRDGRIFRISPMTTEMAKNFLAQSLGMPRSY
jgi:acyl-CoA dehydrogenase